MPINRELNRLLTTPISAPWSSAGPDGSPGRLLHWAANGWPNHLHGGMKGFNRHAWEAAIDHEALILNRLSPDREEGYPGALAVKVKYSFDDRNQLTLEYEAESDRDTVVNLTNRSYFNLNGAGRYSGPPTGCGGRSYRGNRPAPDSHRAASPVPGPVFAWKPSSDPTRRINPPFRRQP